MARHPRIVVPGVPLHIVQRGNDRRDVFHSAEDFERYLSILNEARTDADCVVHAYVLMSNHVHLVVTPNGDRAPAQLMQMIGRRYVPWYNVRYGHAGTLWEGRYWSAPIDSDAYLLACMRYVDLNPVRACIVERPSDYRWSSYRANAVGTHDALVTRHPLYLALAESRELQAAAYRALADHALSPETVGAIRTATWRGTPIGDDDFRQALDARRNIDSRRASRGGDRRGTAFRAWRAAGG